MLLPWLLARCMLFCNVNIISETCPMTSPSVYIHYTIYGHINIFWYLIIITVHHRYVKTYLLPDRSKTTKKKTGVKKGVDPIFNEVIKVSIY